MNQLKTNLHSINPKPLHTSIKNQQEKLHPKANSQSIIPKTIDTGSNQNRCTQHQPSQSTRHQISFWLVSLVRKLSLFGVCLPLCHSVRSRRRSRRIHVRVINPRPPGVGVTVVDGGRGTGKSTFHHPSSALKGTFSPGRR